MKEWYYLHNIYKLRLFCVSAYYTLFQIFSDTSVSTIITNVQVSKWFYIREYSNKLVAYKQKQYCDCTKPFLQSLSWQASSPFVPSLCVAPARHSPSCLSSASSDLTQTTLTSSVNACLVYIMIFSNPWVLQLCPVSRIISPLQRSKVLIQTRHISELWSFLVSQSRLASGAISGPLQIKLQ